MSLDLSIFRDAAQYLRMSEEKKMEIMAKQLAQAKTIGGPKPVWCPCPEDPDAGYTRGLWDGKVQGIIHYDNVIHFYLQREQLLFSF